MSSAPDSVSSATNSVSLPWHTNNRLRGTHCYLWPEGWNPLRGHPGKRDLLEASEWPTLFSRSVENEHTFPRPLKSLFGASESLSGL